MATRPPWVGWSLWAAVIAACAVGAVWFVSGGGMFSPGPLAEAGAPGVVLGGVASHAELAGDCGACHAPPVGGGTMGDRCLTCHVETRRETVESTGLHGAVEAVEDCRACHTEHHGAAAELTRVDDLALEHGRFGFSLALHRTTARGTDFACADCHGPSGFTFDPGDCRRCHEEYQPDFTAEHANRFGDDCMACHDGSGAAGVDHTALGFPLTGGHADVSCAACHGETARAEDFAAVSTGCVDCHGADDAHDGGFGADCASCHTIDGWEGARFDHEFPLRHGSRRNSDCAVCHLDAPRDYDTYTCYGCHEHSPARIRGEHLEEGIRDFEDCVSCHPTGREHEGRRR